MLSPVDFNLITDNIPLQLVEEKSGSVSISGALAYDTTRKFTGTPISLSISSPVVLFNWTSPRNSQTYPGSGTILTNDVLYGLNYVVYLAASGHGYSVIATYELSGSTLTPVIYTIWDSSPDGTSTGLTLRSDTFQMRFHILATPN